MNLPDYPVPNLDVTLQEVSRVLQLTLSPDLYPEFKNVLDQQRELLQEAQQNLATRLADQENWVTHQFKKSLLSCDDPLPTSTALPVVLPPSKAKKSTQLERAAALLWAAAKLYCEPLLLEGDVPMERTQQSEVFAASRIPGRTQDQIMVYPDSLHAIITCVGGVFPVDILWRPSTGGPLTARPVIDIYNQLAQVMDEPSAGKQNDPSAICNLSALDRKTWAGIREQILGKGGEAAESLGLMECAVLTLCLEDQNAPSDVADILNLVRLGGGDSPCLRYYDKVVNLVVFKDGTAGMLYEHSALDGMVAVLVTERVYNLSETADLKLVQTAPENVNGSVTSNHFNSVSPTSLTFPLQGLNIPKSSPDVKTAHPVLTFDLPSYPDVFSTIRGHRGLYDAWINFSLQLSLRQTLGESAASHILVTPTHMRHYKHGRCDPTYSSTMNSQSTRVSSKTLKVVMVSPSYLRYFGGSADYLSCFAQVVGEQELWAVHLALHPQASLLSVARKRYAHLSASEGEISVDSNIPWGVDSLVTLVYLDGKYSLKTCNSRFLSNDGKLVKENTNATSFTLELKSGKLAFKDCEGKYLTPIGPTGTLRSGRCSKPGKDELFDLEESHPQVVFQAVNKRFVSVKQGVSISANQDAETDMETFQMEIDKENKKAMFRTNGGSYWTLVTHAEIQSTATEV
ncbi:isoaspartyl peptidase/L-asparaginase [Solea senegalensis]|nr:isoaspartyl peptidase/L-asparaginase [Solea senegalensis]